MDAKAGDGVVVAQAAQQLDLSRIEADLLESLAQRRRCRTGIVGLDTAARQADLSGVIPEMCRPLGEDDVRPSGRATNPTSTAAGVRSPSRIS